jgi:hypothetical protein
MAGEAYEDFRRHSTEARPSFSDIFAQQIRTLGRGEETNKLFCYMPRWARDVLDAYKAWEREQLGELYDEIYPDG